MSDKEKEIYFIQKRGFNIRGIFGIFEDRDKAIHHCKNFASKDSDSYHQWEVVESTLNKVYDFDSDFAFEEAIIFKTRKDGACNER